MEAIITKFYSIVEKITQVYFPAYIDWLTNKLEAGSSFGTLALVGFLSFFFLFIYLLFKNRQN